MGSPPARVPTVMSWLLPLFTVSVRILLRGNRLRYPASLLSEGGALLQRPATSPSRAQASPRPLGSTLSECLPSFHHEILQRHYWYYNHVYSTIILMSLNFRVFNLCGLARPRKYFNSENFSNYSNSFSSFLAPNIQTTTVIP